MGFEMYVDEQGVPYSDYGIYHGLDIGRQRSVLAVAERGLWYWNSFLCTEPAEQVLLSYNWTRYPKNKELAPSSAEQAQQMLIHCADWLLDNVQERVGFSVWTYPYPFSYGTKPGWKSGHTQAVGMQLLVRAQTLSQTRDYLTPLGGLLAAFQVDVADGGLCTRTDGGNTWFEKMADPDNQQPKVLNGLLFAIIGLLDVARWTDHSGARHLGQAGIAAAVELLPRFDLGDWSAYDVHGRRASAHYHQIHILQLRALAGRHPLFAEYAERFHRYQQAHGDR